MKMINAILPVLIQENRKDCLKAEAALKLVSAAKHYPIEVPAVACLEQIGKLRVLAWQHSVHAPVGIAPEGIWLDDIELISRHWVIKDAHIMVGAARLSMHQKLAEIPDADSFLGCHVYNLPKPIAA